MNKSVIDRARAHMKQQLANELSGPILIPEYADEEGNPLEIWFRPSVAFKTDQEILNLQGQGKTGDALFEAVIQRSLDKDGKRMFGPGDKDAMKRYMTTEILDRILRGFGEARGEDADDLEDAALKN